MPDAGDTWLPDREMLYEDLRQFRKLLNSRGERYFKVKTLQRTAQSLFPGERDRDAINHALKLAINRLGANESAEAAAELYCLTPRSKDQELSERWKLAAEAAGAISVDTFRTGQAPELLYALTDALIELLEEPPGKRDQISGNPTTLPAIAQVSDEPADHTTSPAPDDWSSMFADGEAPTLGTVSSVIEDEKEPFWVPPSHPARRRQYKEKRSLRSLLWEFEFVAEHYVRTLEDKHSISRGVRSLIDVTFFMLFSIIFISIIGLIIWIIHMLVT